MNAAGTAPNNDRSNAGLHAKANRVKIISIEEYDANNSIVTVDNGGTTFSTASTTVSSVECPTMISTMPWWTGSCDGVLGSCGSVHSNVGKCPYLLFGVEMALGQYEVCGNAVMKIASNKMNPYVLYDCADISSSAPTSDYEKVGYDILDCNGADKYISKLGFDADNPMCRYIVEGDATSTTGYCDSTYTQKLSEQSDGSREILLFGYLGRGAYSGRRYANLNNGLTNANWNYGARLSASGRCAQAAA